MSAQEAPAELERQLREIVVERVDPATIERGVVEADSGSGQSELFVRILLTANLDALIQDPAAGSGWPVEAFRNALVHEIRLTQLLRSAAPDLGVDGLISILGEAFALIEMKAAAPRAHFSEAELTELSDSGLLRTGSDRAARMAGRTAAEFAALMTHSLSVPEAADRLGVDESRVRQRLADRTLYGIKVGRTWRVPQFQFTELGQVPGLDQVLPLVPSTFHAVALQRWLITPTPDLNLEDEAMSPLQWLEATGDVARVANIARDL